MEKLKRFWKKFFCLPPGLTIVIAIPSFVFVFIMLGTEDSDSALSYISYILSAYALVITATGFPGIIRAMRGWFWNLPIIRALQKTRLGHRFLSSPAFRSEVSLRRGLAMNLLYVALKLVTGMKYRSVWLIALAVYYLLMAVMRGVLVHYVHHMPVGENIPLEFRRYRVCGYSLLFMNQALAAIVVYIVYRNQGFSYPGLLIYGMAVYAFYCMITAAINVVKFRKLGSPILSAAKAVNLTAAFVSMLSLETAMLSEFGGDDFIFRKYMTGISGGLVCTFVLGMAVYMIVRSTRYLKKHPF